MLGQDTEHARHGSPLQSWAGAAHSVCGCLDMMGWTDLGCSLCSLSDLQVSVYLNIYLSGTFHSPIGPLKHSSVLERFENNDVTSILSQFLHLLPVWHFTFKQCVSIPHTYIVGARTGCKPHIVCPSVCCKAVSSPEWGPTYGLIWVRKANALWIFPLPIKQPSSLNNHLVSVDCKKGARVQVDSSQRMLRIAEPDARLSGFYSMQRQNHLQADNFYQTVWSQATWMRFWKTEKRLNLLLKVN